MKKMSMSMIVLGSMVGGATAYAMISKKSNKAKQKINAIKKELMK